MRLGQYVSFRCSGRRTYRQLCTQNDRARHSPENWIPIATEFDTFPRTVSSCWKTPSHDDLSTSIESKNLSVFKTGSLGLDTRLDI